MVLSDAAALPLMSVQVCTLCSSGGGCVVHIDIPGCSIPFCSVLIPVCIYQYDIL